TTPLFPYTTLFRSRNALCGIRLHRLPIYSRMIRKGGCNRVFLIGRARRLPSENRRYSDFDQQEHNDTLRGWTRSHFSSTRKQSTQLHITMKQSARERTRHACRYRQSLV